MYYYALLLSVSYDTSNFQFALANSIARCYQPKECLFPASSSLFILSKYVHKRSNSIANNHLTFQFYTHVAIIILSPTSVYVTEAFHPSAS